MTVLEQVPYKGWAGPLASLSALQGLCIHVSLGIHVSHACVDLFGIAWLGSQNIHFSRRCALKICRGEHIYLGSLPTASFADSCNFLSYVAGSAVVQDSRDLTAYMQLIQQPRNVEKILL